MPPHMLLISLHCRHKTAASTMLALQMYVHTPHTVLHGLVVIGCMLSGAYPSVSFKLIIFSCTIINCPIQQMLLVCQIVGGHLVSVCF